jgi:hypothetical protein
MRRHSVWTAGPGIQHQTTKVTVEAVEPNDGYYKKNNSVYIRIQMISKYVTSDKKFICVIHYVSSLFVRACMQLCRSAYVWCFVKHLCKLSFQSIYVTNSLKVIHDIRYYHQFRQLFLQFITRIFFPVLPSNWCLFSDAASSSVNTMMNEIKAKS